jgi:hypothetical protein
MKLLLLILIISCGKQVNGPYIDFKDADGDQIINAQEKGIEKYIAHSKSIGPIQGVMSFRNSQKNNERVEVPFGNDFDYKSQGLRLLTTNKLNLKTDPYFTDWSKVRFKSKFRSFVKSRDDLIEIKFNFTNIPNDSLLIFIQSQNKKKYLAKTSGNLTLNISSKDFFNLSTGDSFLFFEEMELKDSTKEFEISNRLESIRKTTYPVIWYDGEKGKILYISKKFKFDQFLLSQKISHLFYADELELFFPETNSSKLEWWTRKIDNGYRILVKTHLSEISNFYKKDLISKTTSIQRLNGINQNELKIQKNLKARFYLQIKGTQTLLSFKERKKRITYAAGQGGREGDRYHYDCTYYYNEIADRQKITLSREDLLKYIRVQSELGPIDLNQSILFKEEVTENGYKWIIGFDTLASDITIKLLNKNSKSYHKTGLINNKCDKNENPKERVQFRLLNNEEKLNLNITSYVEKIEE